MVAVLRSLIGLRGQHTIFLIASVVGARACRQPAVRITWEASVRILKRGTACAAPPLSKGTCFLLTISRYRSSLMMNSLFFFCA
ncbi:uncharacterized protein B0I36DRAFT_136037 [Microdochium trichocladiopsis]|uniref:Uncharacterized protein n=1 Tax=Microdochium trichocladiopsis TaxID=1682393 RepID=A0A9P8Y1H3_9PEZI|nr:uncharacterized protein B0I36DRAFT_136037 [Microdochium trichocladiopsis]KAH7027183.1 hypothetical protein B0I36DRAFT_136037 [Microdochium trichocladiopsis]